MRFGRYEIDAKCQNCGCPVKIRIPRGTTIADFAKGKVARCSSCGCEIDMDHNEFAFRTKWLK